MADVLVDTSVWIDFFRSESGATGKALDSLLSKDQVILCGVVEMEIFQGLRDGELAEVQSAFELIPYVETTRENFIAAGALSRNLRKKGKTIPSTDCLIAELCIRNDLMLFSLDSHFDEIRELKRFSTR